jgi:hypothetical protein
MKHFFFSLQTRERIMALLALVIGAIIWSTASWSRVNSGWDAWRALENENQVQQTWLKNEPAIRQNAAKAIQGLEAGRGYNDSQLVAEALAATKEVGLNASTETPKTQKAGKFALHTMQLSCRRADMASVVKLYENLRPRAPYISISSFSLQSDRGNSGTVTLTMQLTALELITAK